MLTTIINSVLALLQVIAPSVAAGEPLAKAIGLLTTIVPAVIQEAKDLYPTIKNLIAILRSTDGITQEQLDALDAAEAQIDADWQKASDAADAEDAAAAPTDGQQTT